MEQINVGHYKNKKCLVTGGAGFIGSSLVIKLVESGAQVTVLDSLKEDMGGNLFNLEPVINDIELQIADIRDENAIQYCIANKDIIFNLASFTSHSDSIRNPIEDLSINALGQLMFLEACRKINLNARIVYTGTRNEYGLVKNEPIDEEHKLDPSDPNSVSKTAGGSYHLLYSRLYDMPIVYLRLPNVYGPRHQMLHHRQGVMNWFIRQILDGIEIKIYGDGEQIRDCNFVDDVVEALLVAGYHENAVPQVFNLGGNPVSLNEYVETLIKVAGKGTYAHVPFPEESKKIEIGDYVANTDKIQRALGWKSKTSLPDGLKVTLDYYSRYREHYWS